MNKFYFMVGIPGSGKSTYAEKLKNEGCVVHSSDKIREELGDINDQSKNSEVFMILHKRIKDDLRDGKDVVYDATNLNRKRRMAFLRELKNISCKKIGILVATPFEECCKQNNSRDRRVPDDVMWRMYKSFQMPSIFEGFDKVIVHYEKEEWKEYYGHIIDCVTFLCGFDQQNSHHKLTLGNHMLEAGTYVLDNNDGRCDDLYCAAISHDIGKPEVKSFYNKKGELDSDAHYYNHHQCGAYKCLFYEYLPDSKKENIALLIEYHMKPYMEWKQSEKVKQRDIDMFGEQFYEDVMAIHQADLYAH